MKWEDLTTYDRSVQILMGKEVRNAKKYSAQLLHTMRSARRFALTDNAAERVRAAMASYPELLAINSEFALQPFETMWVEFDSRKLVGDDVLSPIRSEQEDTRVGYLFHQGHVTVFAENHDMEPAPTLIGYQLHRPMRINEEIKMADNLGTSRMGLDGFLWGHTLSSYLEDAHVKSLRAQHSIVLTQGITSLFSNNDELLHGLLQHAYYGSAGELRNIIAMLLMINQPAKLISMREVPRQRGIVRGKPLPYFGHSEIDINLDRKQRARIFSKPLRGTHASPRWHEVRGHFAHNLEGRSGTCDHAWREIEPKRWECAKGCGGKRWWRELPNGRGNAAIGYVHQKRQIRTDNDAASMEDAA